METSKNPEQNEAEEIKKKRIAKRYCSIPQCSKNALGALHRFPKDPVLRKKWEIACRIGKPINNYMAVCNKHFLASDFIPRWDRQLKRLKTIAVPSQNLSPRPLPKNLNTIQLINLEDRAARAAKRLERQDPRYETILANKQTVANINIKSTESSKKKNDSQSKAEIHLNVIDDATKNLLQNENENSIQTSLVAVNSEKKKLDENKSKITKSNSDHNYSYLSCKCDKIAPKTSTSTDNPEIRAAKVLVEMNEKVFEMIKNNEITFATKDMALNVVEQFYSSARKYFKTTIHLLIKNDFQLHFYTGIDSNLLRDLQEAMIICEGGFCEKYELKPAERIVLCFIKLRLNISFVSLSSLFCVTEQTCKNVFFSTIQTLKVILRSAIYWPTRDEILKYMPQHFEDFKKTIAVLDRTGIEIEKSVCSECRLPNVSENKNYPSFKILLGFANCGFITYVSRAIHGHTLNQTITDEAYISKVLVPNCDAIMTDGFFMEEECNRVFIDCIKTRRGKPFCPDASARTKSKVIIETQIENAFRRFKMFKIFQKAIPSDMASYVDDISVVVCGIVNLNNPTVASTKFQ